MSAPPAEPTCGWRDTAWSFVLGSSSETESAEFREHLFDGCAMCGAELARARASIAELDLAAAERDVAREGAALPEDLRARLRATLPERPAATHRTPFSELLDAGSFGASHSLPSCVPGVSMVLSSSDDGWFESEVEGVRFKTLAHDRERRFVTALVRMEPGSAYPAHRHGGREECYVLSGDLAFGEHRFSAGDYQVAEEGSVHPVQSTEEGCLLLIVSSEDDELQ